MSTPTEVAQRRANVRRLWRGGASNRAIAEQLGIHHRTVARDLEWFELPLAERVAQRVAQTDEAVRQARAAAQAAADMRPAHVPTDAETARRWHDQLRATAAQLAALADEFTDHTPTTECATDPTGGAS
ncbi:hypothetical protein [Streptomyces sp.]|uniref:hypothetical protein n=1 Tax=Streptomyces sp. TaxID=1931 RepID=UPI002F94B38D